MVIFLGFIGEIFKHQTRQIRYTRNQLYKIGQTFYITKVNDTTANTIKSLGISQTFRIRRRDRKRKIGGKKHVRPWDTNQGIHRNLLIPLVRHHKTLWNPSINELMLTNIQSLKLKIDMIIPDILQHKLDICFITETWVSKIEDLQYMKANLRCKVTIYYHVKGKTEKEEVWHYL